MIILLAVFIEKCWLHKNIIKAKNIVQFVNLNYEKIIGYFGMLIISAFTMGGGIYLGIALQMNIDYGRNTKEMNELCSKIEGIDENMIAFGQGVPELFAAMNRSTNFYIGDWSDINAARGELVDKTILNCEYFFANTGSIPYLVNAWAFDLVETYELKGYGTYGEPQEYTFGIYKNRYWQEENLQ